MNFSRKAFSILLFVALALRIWFIFNFPLLETNEEDAVSRLWIAIQWVEKNNFFSLPSMGWLPGHGLLLSIPLLVGAPTIISTQLLTLCFGIALIGVYFFWVKQLFGETKAIVTTALFSLSPLYIYFSTITMAEVPALFFLVSSFYVLNLYFTSQHRKHLYFAILLLTVTNTIRIETWPVALVLFPFFVFSRTKNLRLGLETLLMGAVWPLIYLILSYILFGVPNYYLKVMGAFALAHGNSQFEFLSFLGSLNTYFGASIWLLPLGLVSILKKRQDAVVTWGIVALAGIVLVKALSYGMFYPRYLALFLPLLLPYAIDFVLELKSKRVVVQSILGASFALTLFSIFNLHSKIPNQRLLASGFFESANWVKKNIDSKDLLYFDGGFWAEGTFFIATDRRKQNTFFNQTDSAKLKDYDPVAKVLHDLKNHFPEGRGYLVFNQSPSAPEQSFLNRGEVQVAVKQDYEVEQLSQLKDFVVWKLSPH